MMAPLDELGNPLVQITGCPNCGKREPDEFEWMNVIRYAGLCNSGFDPNGPCSRRCQLQIEHADHLAATTEHPS